MIKRAEMGKGLSKKLTILFRVILNASKIPCCNYKVNQ